MEKKSYNSFFKSFNKPYQPKYGFCPTCLIQYIMEYFEVSIAEATEIYAKSSSYYGSIARLSDFLYEEIVIKGTHK